MTNLLMTIQTIFRRKLVNPLSQIPSRFVAVGVFFGRTQDEAEKSSRYANGGN